MNALRALRRDAGLGQREFADALDVPLETLRTWDSGRRSVPPDVLHTAEARLSHHKNQHELLPLAQLARELHVHVRTLQAAARTGRLTTHFTIRSVFGHPLRFATRTAGEQFLKTHYRHFEGQRPCPLPLPSVPENYDEHLRALRRRFHLTQGALAQRLGAANKAVVYQWESRKRTPSPVLWQRVLDLG